MTDNSKILIVEDDAAVRQSLSETLGALGFDCTGLNCGEEALQYLDAFSCDAVLLDLNMPGIGGKETCSQIYATYPRLPIIILTVRDSQDDIIGCLDAGAWDYVTKPFQVPVLAARLRAVIRRNDVGIQGSETVSVGDIKLDQDRRLVEKKGERIHLSPKEYETLLSLMENAGRPVRHERLLKSSWGLHHGGEREYLRVIINQLRKKIEDNPSAPTYIVTENYVGYSFRKE